MEAKQVELELRVENLALREVLRSTREQISGWKTLHSNLVQASQRDVQLQTAQRSIFTNHLLPVRVAALRELGPAAKSDNALPADHSTDKSTRGNHATTLHQVAPFDAIAINQYLKPAEQLNFAHNQSIIDDAMGNRFLNGSTSTGDLALGDDSTSAPSPAAHRSEAN